MLTDKTTHTQTHTQTKKKFDCIKYWILNYTQFPIFDKVITLLSSDKILRQFVWNLSEYLVVGRSYTKSPMDWVDFTADKPAQRACMLKRAGG
jgi:hypothetical protein